MSKDVTIGIDLGTSNSCVCAIIDGKPKVLANRAGEQVIASVVAFREDGRIEVGNGAKAGIILDPKHTVSSAKRLIGRYFFSEEVRKARAVVISPNGDYYYSRGHGLQLVYKSAPTV